MKVENVVGIDVSKETLDFALVRNGNNIFHCQASNDQSGIKAVIKKLKKEFNCNLSTSLFCMEHTGIYNQHLLDLFEKKKLKLWLESSMQIKKSLGMQRGKNDQIDALWIAMYAYRFQDKMKLWEPPRTIIRQLKHLSSLRSRLLRAQKQLQAPLKEQSLFFDKKTNKEITSHCKNSLTALTRDHKKVNEQIQNIIQQDEVLKKLFLLIISIDGVGPVTATEMIITTNEFKHFNTASQYACYAGVAPFEHKSGTSIRGKTRVSHMANKTIKTILHMAALAAKLQPGEIRNYYERKLKEGKHKMSIMNAIRNKLIKRVFAVVHRNQPYQKNYQFDLV
jgi:transposase